MIDRRRALYTTLALIVVAGLTAWWLRTRSSAPESSAAPVARATQPRPGVAPRAAKLAALAAEIPPESISPIADALGAPNGTIRRDVEILNEVLVAWQTNFPRDGNPTGENEEITVALAGDNRLHFAFIAPNHPAIDPDGRLCDRWGTPFRFHALSGTQMEIRSAGPDRKFGSADDVEFAPWPKQL